MSPGRWTGEIAISVILNILCVVSGRFFVYEMEMSRR